MTYLRLSSLAGALVCLLLFDRLAQAEIIYGTGLTGIYSVDPSTRVSTELFDLSTWSPGGVAWDSGGNAMAYDSAANQLIFSERNGTRLATYNVGTGATAVIANLDSFASLTSQISDGTTTLKLASSGMFYNNIYYFTVENMDGNGIQNSRMFWASLNSSHNSVTSIGNVSFGGGNPFLGDFGDMAITNGGTVYASSTDHGAGGSITGVWKFNLANTAAGITVLDSTAASTQLAFDHDGVTLYAHHAGSADFGTINLATGAYTNSGALTGDTNYLSDLSESFTAVPEPSSLGLTGLGLALAARRNRRQAVPSGLADMAVA